MHIIDECLQCGSRGATSERKFRKQRSRDLASMMESFSKHADNPDTALHGMQTLMGYNEERWFMDLQHSYGRRFYDHMQVQFLIAQGLCRFGHFNEAATYCRKAIVLGAGPKAEELLALCQSMSEKATVDAPVESESLVRPYAFLMACAAALATILVFQGLSAMHHHNAWLVNGSPFPYSVEIDGKIHRLLPRASTRIKLRLGEHEMMRLAGPKRNAPVLFEYTTPLVKQKLAHESLVLNPDGLALLLAETMHKNNTTNRFYVGETVYILTGINHPFSKFPAWASAKRSPQSRLFLHPATNHLDAVKAVDQYLGHTKARTHARRILQADPAPAEIDALLSWAVDDMPIDAAVAFLKQGRLDAAPKLGWHLFYQDYMTEQDCAYDLQKEYALLCKQHPDTSLYYYLLGRVAHNPDSAHKLFIKSEKGPGSNGLGYAAIARNLLCSGRFKEALPFSEKALDRDPGNVEFNELNMRIHLALRQYDPLIFQIRRVLADEPSNPQRIADLIKFLTLAGEHQAAAETAARFPDAQVSLSAYFNAARYYAVGNATDYADAMTESGIVVEKLQLPLMNSDIQKAHALLSQNEEHDYSAHLVMYCAAQRYAHPEIAEIELAKAIREISPKTYDRKKAVAMLSGATPSPSQQELAALRLMPQEKAILCTALGFMHPQQQTLYFRIAQNLNYTPEYPQLLLKKWMRQPSRSVGTP
ncbi:tetratricopeptide repeat protein [Pontiella sulfatireligans]|uniref:tetratricopeptide repeat protein n=1 Tax=Pontiella sulfatireligans TaxID=2750658 RepID=UPI00109C826C|nr:hypothetical protein [Pontiella sulfatireligans]